MIQVMAMRGNETLTIVLPTGAGKSVLFILLGVGGGVGHDSGDCVVCGVDGRSSRAGVLEWYRLYALGARTTIECRIADASSICSSSEREYRRYRIVSRVYRQFTRL